MHHRESNIGLFLFIVAIPILIALGHDLYLFYINMERGFMLSTPGFIWTQYHPESYKWIVEQTAPRWWPYINFVLGLKAVVVAAFFSSFILILTGIIKIISPSQGGSTSSSEKRIDKILGNKTKSRIKYNRK